MGCTSSKPRGAVDKFVGDDFTVSEYLGEDLLFSQLSTSLLLKATSYFKVLEERNQPDSAKRVLLARGSVAQSLFFVVSGRVVFISKTKDGVERELRELQPHDKFGEFGVINGASSRVDVVLKGNGVVLELPKKALNEHGASKAFARLNTWLLSTESAMMAQKLKDVDFMSNIDDDQLQLIARLFQSRILQKGEVLVREKEMLDRFFIIAKGTLVLTVKDENSMFLELTRLGVGDIFGELALLENQESNTTVTALEETMVFSLTGKAFEQFFDLANDLYKNLKQRILERNAVAIVSNRTLFAKSLSKDKLHMLGTVARMQKFPAGETIFKEGSVDPKTFFIVARGKVDVLKKDKVLRTMEDGEYFGEVSLVSDKPHTASVKVSDSGPLYCLTIDQADFNAVFMRERAILAEIQIKVLGDKIELKHCLNHPGAQEFFLKQLEKEYAVENIHFWTAADKMESLGKQRFDPVVIQALGLDMKVFTSFIHGQLQETAMDIYNKYLAPDSPNQINVRDSTFQEIRKRVENEKFTYEMYSDAMHEIYQLLESDNFARFKRSNLFKEMLQALGTYNS